MLVSTIGSLAFLVLGPFVGVVINGIAGLVISRDTDYALIPPWCSFLPFAVLQFAVAAVTTARPELRWSPPLTRNNLAWRTDPVFLTISGYILTAFHAVVAGVFASSAGDWRFWAAAGLAAVATIVAMIAWQRTVPRHTADAPPTPGARILGFVSGANLLVLVALAVVIPVCRAASIEVPSWTLVINALVGLAVSLCVIVPALRWTRRGPLARLFGATPLSVFFLSLAAMFLCGIVLLQFGGEYRLGPPGVWLLATAVALVAAWWGPGGVRRGD